MVWAGGWEARNRELLEKNIASCEDVGKEKAAGCAGMILVPGTGDLAFGPKSWTEVMNIFSETLGKSFHSWGPRFLHLGNGKNNTCFQSRGFVCNIRDYGCKSPNLMKQQIVVCFKFMLELGFFPI